MTSIEYFLMVSILNFLIAYILGWSKNVMMFSFLTSVVGSIYLLKRIIDEAIKSGEL
jgi:hypothetical protein